jgi:hypothetical protein
MEADAQQSPVCPAGGSPSYAFVFGCGSRKRDGWSVSGKSHMHRIMPSLEPRLVLEFKVVAEALVHEMAPGPEWTAEFPNSLFFSTRAEDVLRAIGDVLSQQDHEKVTSMAAVSAVNALLQHSVPGSSPPGAGPSVALGPAIALGSSVALGDGPLLCNSSHNAAADMDTVPPLSDMESSLLLQHEGYEGADAISDPVQLAHAIEQRNRDRLTGVLRSLMGGSLLKRKMDKDKDLMTALMGEESLGPGTRVNSKALDASLPWVPSGTVWRMSSALDVQSLGAFHLPGRYRLMVSNLRLEPVENQELLGEITAENLERARTRISHSLRVTRAVGLRRFSEEQGQLTEASRTVADMVQREAPHELLGIAAHKAFRAQSESVGARPRGRPPATFHPEKFGVGLEPHSMVCLHQTSFPLGTVVIDGDRRASLERTVGWQLDLMVSSGINALLDDMPHGLRFEWVADLELVQEEVFLAVHCGHPLAQQLSVLRGEADTASLADTSSLDPLSALCGKIQGPQLAAVRAPTVTNLQAGQSKRRRAPPPKPSVAIDRDLASLPMMPALLGSDAMHPAFGLVKDMRICSPYSFGVLPHCLPSSLCTNLGKLQSSTFVPMEHALAVSIDATTLAVTYHREAEAWRDWRQPGTVAFVKSPGPKEEPFEQASLQALTRVQILLQQLQVKPTMNAMEASLFNANLLQDAISTSYVVKSITYAMTHPNAITWMPGQVLTLSVTAASLVDRARPAAELGLDASQLVASILAENVDPSTLSSSGKRGLPSDQPESMVRVALQEDGIHVQHKDQHVLLQLPSDTEAALGATAQCTPITTGELEQSADYECLIRSLHHFNLPTNAANLCAAQRMLQHSHYMEIPFTSPTETTDRIVESIRVMRAEV